MNPEVKVGQVWRRKKNGRHIVIVRENTMFEKISDDWAWKGLDYKGHGYSYGSYIQRDCELVANSVEEFNRG